MISSMVGIALDCPNADVLADFYARLLGWEKIVTNGEYAALRTPQGMLLVCQTVPHYVPPVWPWQENAQQQMAHIDFHVDSLPEAVAHALGCGAKKADVQYYESAAVMLDPAGHPFCLSTAQAPEPQRGNGTLQAIARRFACRSFTNRLPEEKDLMAVAQAAIQAPSAMNRQPWHVMMVRDRILLEEMDAEGMRILAAMEDQSTYRRILSRGGKLFYNAPCMMLVAIQEVSPKGAELMDCGILAQNAVVAATSLGMDTLHCGLAAMAFAGDKAADFKRRLQFPKGYGCGIGILLGYAAQSNTPHAPDQAKITFIG